MFSKIEETRNVLSTIESQGLRKEMTSVTEFLKLVHILREMTPGSERRLVLESCFGRRRDSRKFLL